MTHRNSPRSTLAARLLMVIALALPNCSHAGGSSPNSVWPPASINQVPFVNGALVVPNRFPAGPNNRGVITDQTLPGMTHIECYMEWPRMEPEKDKWDTAEFDEMLALSKQYGLKMEALPSLCFAPKWLEVSSSFTPVQDCITGNTTNYFSPWAPSSYQAFDHFYSFLASRYRGQIDILKFPIEVGLLVPKSTGGLADHKGLWCGDRFARADFHAFFQIPRYRLSRPGKTPARAEEVGGLSDLVSGQRDPRHGALAKGDPEILPERTH